jgi:hypothetical protein
MVTKATTSSGRFDFYDSSDEEVGKFCRNSDSLLIEPLLPLGSSEHNWKHPGSVVRGAVARRVRFEWQADL